MKDSEGTVFAKDKLIAAICNDPDLPSLGSSISRVVQLSSSDDESIRQLASLVLSDVSLTQKILRLSNSATFRTVSGQIVTSISRAIFLLGFDTIKTCALAMILVEAMSGKHAESVRTELIRALAASMIGRELAKRSYFKDSEEIAIAALFKNIGRLLIAAYDHSLYQKMMKLVEDGSHTPVQASMEILNCNIDLFTTTILQEWEIPSGIIKALKPLSSGPLRPPKNRQEWMQQVVELSEAAIPLILQPAESSRDALEAKLLNRFGKTLNLDKAQFKQLIIDATMETSTLSNNAQLKLPPGQKHEIGVDTADKIDDTDTNAEEDLLSELLYPVDNSANLQTAQYYPSGKPYNAHERLLAGVNEAATMIASKQYTINNLILLVLEILYNSLGFRFATICLKDIKINQYRARNSLGENYAEVQRGFIFPSISTTDLFSLAIQRNVDLLISDASAQKVRNLIPHWHHALLPDANSFIVLPLVIDNKPIGLIYADRIQIALEGISPDEMIIIRTLKKQILTALSTK